MKRDPAVWLVTGDKPGDNAQLHVIAEALGLPYQIRRMIPREEYVYGKPAFKASLYHLDMEKSDSLVPPWPDLVLTIGRRPAMAAQWIRAQSGGKTRVVLFGRPKKMADEFALIILTGQYLMAPRHNTVFLDLPLMRIDPDRMHQAMQYWQPRWESLPRPLTAVMIGGPTDPYRMDVPVIQDLLAKVANLAAGGSLYISTSRRTPEAVINYLQLHKPANCMIYAWQADDPENPYLGLMGLADQFMVTGDSLSMMVEISRLGKPLAIYALPRQRGVLLPAARWVLRQLRRLPGDWSGRLFGYGRDLERIHSYLLEQGLTTTPEQPFKYPEVAVDTRFQELVSRIRGLLDNA